MDIKQSGFPRNDEINRDLDDLSHRNRHGGFGAAPIKPEGAKEVTQLIADLDSTNRRISTGGV